MVKRRDAEPLAVPEILKKTPHHGIDWAMQPLHFSMALVGLQFTINKSRKARSVASVFYYCLVLALNLYDLVRYFRTYESGMAFGPTLVMKICVHVSYVTIIMGEIVQLKYSLSRKKIVASWEAYIKQYKVKKGLLIALRRKCILITCIGWMMILSIVTGFSYELHLKDSITRLLFAYSLSQDSPLEATLLVVMQFYSAAVMSFSVYHLMALCAGLAQEFNEINDDIKRKINEDGGMPVDLAFHRQRHRRLAAIVTQVDDVFSFYNLFSIVVNVGMSCLTMYSVFTVNTDSPGKYASIAALFLFYMGIFLMIPLAVSFAGVHLHQAIFIMLVTYTVILLKFGNNEYSSSLFGFTSAINTTAKPSPTSPIRP